MSPGNATATRYEVLVLGVTFPCTQNHTSLARQKPYTWRLGTPAHSKATPCATAEAPKKKKKSSSLLPHALPMGQLAISRRTHLPTQHMTGPFPAIDARGSGTSTYVLEARGGKHASLSEGRLAQRARVERAWMELCTSL